MRSKAVLLILGSPVVRGGSVFDACFVMQYLVSFLVLQSLH